MNKINGIIFDMDGVLVDSEPVIEAAARAGLAEYGIKAVPEDFHPFVGAGEDRYIGGVAEKYGVPFKLEMKARVYEIYLEMVDKEIGIYEGIPELLAELRRMGYKLALASSADRIKVDANLKAAKIDPSVFEVLLSGSDVERKKPFPDIYLKACEGLGIDPSNALIIEDAVNGVQAAKAAGCYCCGITSSFSAEALRAEGADFIKSETPSIIELLKG